MSHHRMSMSLLRKDFFVRNVAVVLAFFLPLDFSFDLPEDFRGDGAVFVVAVWIVLDLLQLVFQKREVFWGQLHIKNHTPGGYKTGGSGLDFISPHSVVETGWYTHGIRPYTPLFFISRIGSRV